jgi:cytochrome P450
MFERWVLEEGVDISGTPVARGAKVGLLFGSGNHDEVIFGRTSDSLDLARAPNPHLAFGAGLHFCVGAPLARVELEVAFDCFARSVRSFSINSVGARIESLVFRGVESLELELVHG